MSAPSFVIREAISSDVPHLMSLIHELAAFEKAPEKVWNTESQLLADGFGDHPKFNAWVAINTDQQICGMAIAYEAFSTWKGRFYYLDDLYVQAEYRGHGLGKALLEKVLAYADLKKYPMVKWQVLDWNEPAIEFYQKIGATLEPEWINCQYYF